MIGLDIEVENKYDQYLKKIFKGVDVSKYFWQIVYFEILGTKNEKVDDELSRIFFPKELLTGDEFLGCISREKYYMIFAEIKVFPIQATQVQINTYKDYLQSDCEMVFLCNDNSYIKLFCKNEMVLQKIYNNCMEFNFIAKYIFSESNDFPMIW